MRILNNMKLTFVCIVGVLCAFVSYGLLPLSVDILTGNDLLGLFLGFTIVPIGIGLYISAIFSALSLIVSGIFNKTTVWWILGILLAIADVGAAIVAFIQL